MAHAMARVRMPRLLALVAAAAAIALAAAASAQTAPGTPGALIYGGNGTVTLDGTAVNGADITATDANGVAFEAAWDTAGWSVEVTANSQISFTVNGQPVADPVASGRAGSVQSATLAAATPADNGDLLGDEDDSGADDGSMMGADGADDGNGDLLGDEDGGDLLGGDDDNGDSMMGDDSDSMMGDGDDSDSMMGDGGDAGSDEGSMSQMPVGGTGGLLGAGNGTDAWVFGLSGVLVLLGLAGAFAAHRKTTHTA